ncbi:MAG: hypothetical protein GY767_06835 [Shimia sp.]|nr:hypothetical protein [Shimia sp.]MCP4822743.1 hypothetical protein [Shimia sp.]
MTYSATLKRAARFNPAWKQASVYGWAVDETGAAILDAAGEYQFDVTELTFGLRDFTQNETFTLNKPYDGDVTLIVITEETPNPDAVILLDGVFYSVVEMLGGDSLQGTVKYRARAVPTDEPVPIRNNSL